MSTEKITLATLPQATKQQVFDQVARHLLTQYRKSMNEDACAYRGEKGTACAVGCLISDDEYMPSMEGKSWSGVRQYFGIKRTPHDDLLMRLQDIHDDSDPCEWPDLLECLASKFGLNADVLE